MKTHMIDRHEWDEEDVRMFCGRKWHKDWLLTLLAIRQVQVSLGYRYWSRNQRRQQEDWCKSCVKLLRRKTGHV